MSTQSTQTETPTFCDLVTELEKRKTFDQVWQKIADQPAKDLLKQALAGDEAAAKSFYTLYCDE